MRLYALRLRSAQNVQPHNHLKRRLSKTYPVRRLDGGDLLTGATGCRTILIHQLLNQKLL